MKPAPAPKSSAEKVAALRQRRKDLGLVRVEVWVRPEHRPEIRRTAAALVDQSSPRE